MGLPGESRAAYLGGCSYGGEARRGCLWLQYKRGNGTIGTYPPRVGAYRVHRGLSAEGRGLPWWEPLVQAARSPECYKVLHLWALGAYSTGGVCGP